MYCSDEDGIRKGDSNSRQTIVVDDNDDARRYCPCRGTTRATIVDTRSREHGTYVHGTDVPDDFDDRHDVRPSYDELRTTAVPRGKRPSLLRRLITALYIYLACPTTHSEILSSRIYVARCAQKPRSEIRGDSFHSNTRLHTSTPLQETYQ